MGSATTSFTNNVADGPHTSCLWALVTCANTPVVPWVTGLFPSDAFASGDVGLHYKNAGQMITCHELPLAMAAGQQLGFAGKQIHIVDLWNPELPSPEAD